MIKCGLIVSMVLGASISNTTMLPVLITRGLTPVVKACTALVLIPKSEGVNTPTQEVFRALLHEEKKLNGQHNEWTRHIEILKSAVQVAERERGEVTKQLCWVKAAQERMHSKLEDAQEVNHATPKSPYEGKDLKTLQQEESAIINKIISIKEIVNDFSNPSNNGSFWHSSRRAEARGQYTLKLHESYRDLEELRRYKKTLETKE